VDVGFQNRIGPQFTGGGKLGTQHKKKKRYDRGTATEKREDWVSWVVVVTLKFGGRVLERVAWEATS